MKICKNCTVPCEDAAKFCVNCGFFEFITVEADAAKSPDLTHLGGNPSSDDKPVLSDDSEEEEDARALETDNSQEDDGEEVTYEKTDVEIKSLDIIEVKKQAPTIAVKWPMWVKAAVFLMSASIVLIVALLFFWVIAVDEPAPVTEEFVQQFVAVPTNLVGATDSSAQAILESLGFVVVVERVYHDSVAAGNVIDQNPRSGMLQSGDSVSLYVSLGRQSVIMPNLVGMTRDEATVVLAGINIGFAFHSVGEYSESIANDIVISQQPLGGTELFESSRIIFTVSLGMPPEETSINLPRFAINYLPNGGQGTMAPVFVEQGQSHVIVASQFTRSGFTFEGWNTMADGSGFSFTPGATLNNVWVDVNLFAQWRVPQVPEVEKENDEVAHVAVTHIDHVPTSGRVNVPINLTGTAMPLGATVRSPINWSVVSGAGFSISGNVLTVSQAGTVIVRATIPNGRAIGSDFAQYFTITIGGELPAITAPPSAVGEYGTAGSAQLIFTGHPTTFELSGNVPDGVSLTTTGLVQWNEATPAGVHSFTITAINQHGSSVAFSFTLVINA